MIAIQKLWLICSIFAFSQCQTAPNLPTKLGVSKNQNDSLPTKNIEKIENLQFSYDFAQPTLSSSLPELLVEISTIVWLSDELMAGVQDENGIIYFFNPKDGTISDSLIFEPEGDFEGLCFVENTAWVLEAKGSLWEISDWKDEKLRKVSRHKTPLKKDNDAEGLCYDAANQRLLIACKESPFIDDYRKDLRAVYAFDLKRRELNTTPMLTFDIPLIIKYLDKNPTAKIDEKVTKKLEKGKVMPFMPSEIAIHPQTKEVYILASEGMALLVFSGSELKNIYCLDPAIFEQPEGMTFSPNGDLYISSEGKIRPASLNFFKAIITKI